MNPGQLGPEASVLTIVLSSRLGSPESFSDEFSSVDYRE